MKVDSYDLPTVGMDAGGTPQARMFDAPDVKNASGQQMSEMGAAQTKAGVMGTVLASVIKDKIADAATMDRVVKLEEGIREILYAEGTGVMGKSGQEAVFAGRDAVKDLDKLYQDVESSAVDPVEKAMLKKHGTRIIGAAKTQLMGHTLNHLQVWNARSAEARVKSAMQGVGDALPSWEDKDQKRFTDAATNFRASVKDLARVTGSPEALEFGKYASVLHSTNIERLLKMENPDSAKRYYDTYKKEIEYNQHSALEARITDGIDFKDGKNVGEDQFLLATHNLGVNSSIPMPKILEAIESNPRLTEHGKTYAKQKAIELEQERTKQLSRNASDLTNAVVGGATNENDRSQYHALIRKIDSRTDVTETEKGHLKNWLDTRYHISEDRTLAKNLGPLVAFYNLQQTYGQPGSTRMSPQDIIKQAHIYGAFTDNAAAFVNHANTAAGAVHLTDADLSDQLRKMKMSPFYKDWVDYIPRVDNPSATDKAKLALLQSKVVGFISASGQAGGLSGRMSVEKALDMALQPVEVPGTLFTKKKIPLYLLGTVYSGEAKAWPAATKVAHIKTEYYTRYHRFPTDKETKLLLDKLNE